MAKALNKNLAKLIAKSYPPLMAVIYARASQDRKGRQISVGSQVVVGKKFCKARGITVVRVLIDNDLSASRYATEERPEYIETLNLLTSGAANFLWTWENSRAQRELDVFVLLRKILVDVGGYWAYGDRIYDMNDPDDRIATAKDAVDSERESETIRKRVRRGVEARAQSGLWHGKTPYGYLKVYDPRTGDVLKMKKNPETSPIVKEIVQRVVEVGNLTDIAVDLNRRDIPCALGERWRSDQVRRIVSLARDEVAWNDLVKSLSAEQVNSIREVLRIVEKHSPVRVAAKLNEGEWVHPFPGKWTAAKVGNIAQSPAIAGYRVYKGELIGKGKWKPIISDQQRALVLERLGDPARRVCRDGTRVKYLLSGILVCGECGKGVRPACPRGIWVYRCPDGHRRRHMAKVDAYVVEAVLARLESDEAREFFRFQGKKKDLSRAINEVKELRARLNSFADQAADGKLSAVRMSRIEAKLLPKIEAAEACVQQASTVSAVAGVVGAQAREVWAGMSLIRQREVLRAVVRPRLLPTRSGRAPFNPEDVHLSWLGVTASVIRENETVAS